MPNTTSSNIARLSAALVLACAGVAQACPFCNVSGGNLADTVVNDALAARDATTAPSTVPSQRELGALDDRPLNFALSIDLASSYYHYGYMLQDRGLMVQPSFTVSPRAIVRDGWKIEPYLNWFNSIHTQTSPGYAGGHGGHTRVEQQYQDYLAQPHEGTPFPHYHTRLVDVVSFTDAGGGWFESAVRPGVIFTRDPWFVDLYVKARFYPTDFHDTVVEGVAKITYDFGHLWDDRPDRAFSLRWTNLVAHELIDDNGNEETVVETTLEPLWRFKLGSRHASVSLPFTLGLSPNGYYRDTSQKDEAIGYISGGIRGSFELSDTGARSKWFLNVSATYLNAIADSAVFANGGDEGGFVGTVGVGVRF